MISEIAMWLDRILSVVPELVGLWDAAKTNDPQQELQAQLDLTRAIKDRQAKEEIGKP